MPKAALGQRRTLLAWAKSFLQESQLEPPIHDLSLILIDAMLLEPTFRLFRMEVLCLTCILLVAKLSGIRWRYFLDYLHAAFNKLAICKKEIFHCEVWVLPNVPSYFALVPDFTELLARISSLSKNRRHLNINTARLWHHSLNIFVSGGPNLSLSDIVYPLAIEPRTTKKKNQHKQAQLIKTLRHVKDKTRLLDRESSESNKNARIVRLEALSDSF